MNRVAQSRSETQFARVRIHVIGVVVQRVDRGELFDRGAGIQISEAALCALDHLKRVGRRVVLAICSRCDGYSVIRSTEVAANRLRRDIYFQAISNYLCPTLALSGVNQPYYTIHTPLIEVSSLRLS